MGENQVVPWCPTCDRFLSPPSVDPEGSCPKCGQPVDPGRAHASAEDEEPPVPLHLKVLAVSVVVYLGWRFVQGVDWVIQRF